ncbi:DUF2270 domain-containing protein [Halobacterium sp. KA-4]|jgi:uncharacterized membrane protein|uniref:DUF2270 domain-containing protein n=1 Tax=Halobacterium sp. KA-4 TaxID=2896367 RepID=UPI001E3FD887|nr:DUF2270 domain-containing protein [Halobacterium sp. KA-4]MCD2199021.1 DUF2270 domain-containing protein [Halobacterium sp. KA-4]
MPDDTADSTDGDDATASDPELGVGLFETDMGPSSALAHVYRGEIHRMKFWRERLDRTTNWAVVVMAAVLTWAFSGRSNPHYLLLVGVIALGAFLGVEARRYRGYDIWRSRVRTLQENVVAVGLAPDETSPDTDWRERLARDYREPTIKVSAEEAIAHRLRRIYLPLSTVLLVAWVVRVTAFSPVSWPSSAAIGSLPGVVVTAAVAVTYGTAVAVACRPRTWHARGELREEALRKHD